MTQRRLRSRSVRCTRATMRALTVIFLFFTVFYLTTAAPTKTKLQTGLTPTNDAEGKPYIEEVTVESVLQVRTPGKTGRQTRNNSQASLHDGTRVEARQYN